MAPISSNGTTITNTNNIDLDLQFEQDLDRTWVDTDRFPAFHNDYDELQTHSSLNTSNEVQFRARATYNTLSDDVKTEETNVVFINMTTVYGGNAGINLLLNIPTYACG